MMKSISKKGAIVFCLTCFMVLLLTPPGVQAKSIRIGSASIGGLWYIYAVALAELNKKYNPGMEIQVEATGGPAPNIRLIENGDADIGFTTTSHAFLATNGQGWAKGKKYDKFRSMFLLYPSKTNIVTLESSGVKKLSDMNGKVVSPGPAGSGADGLARDMFTALNIKPSKIVNVSQADLSSNLGDGMIHVGIFNGGQPFPAIVELEQSKRITHIQMTKEEMKIMSSKFPYYIETDLSNKGYKYMPKDFKTIAINSYAMAHKDFSEEAVYKIMKTLFEHIEEFRNSISAASETTMEGAKYMNAPLHKGAFKFYKEKGISLPSSLNPID